MPLAKPYIAPPTTTGTPWFPAAIEATWLQNKLNCFHTVLQNFL
jgi:hypothetical protein